MRLNQDGLLAGFNMQRSGDFGQIQSPAKKTAAVSVVDIAVAAAAVVVVVAAGTVAATTTAAGSC